MLKVIFVVACVLQAGLARFIESNGPLNGTPGENLTDEFRFSTGVEILSSCEECLMESKIFLRLSYGFSTAYGETKEWMCVNPSYLLRPSSRISRAVVAEVCDIKFCGHEHLSVPFDISSLVCESRYPYPQLLKNFALYFEGFPVTAYSSYIKTQELRLKACRDVVKSSECDCSPSSSIEVEEPTTDVPLKRKYQNPFWKMAFSK